MKPIQGWGLKCLLGLLVFSNLFLCSAAFALKGDVDGFMSIRPIEDRGCMAVRLRSAPGDIVQGVRWYNNDGSIGFAGMYIGAAQHDDLQLTEMQLVGTDIQGESGELHLYRFCDATLGQF
jgi:hypothetical protein